MHDEMGAALDNLKLLAIGVSVVVGLVNAIVGIAMTMMWRVFTQFKRDVKETLRDYVSNEGAAKIATQSEIEQLMKECHDCELALTRCEQEIKAMDEKCKEIRACQR